MPSPLPPPRVGAPAKQTPLSTLRHSQNTTGLTGIPSQKAKKRKVTSVSTEGSNRRYVSGHSPQSDMIPNPSRNSSLRSEYAPKASTPHLNHYKTLQHNHSDSNVLSQTSRNMSDDSDGLILIQNNNHLYQTDSTIPSTETTNTEPQTRTAGRNKTVEKTPKDKETGHISNKALIDTSSKYSFIIKRKKKLYIFKNCLSSHLTTNRLISY